MVDDLAMRGFGLRAETYRQVRPTYHRLIIDEAVQAMTDGVVVELGAGTGIFTAELFRRDVDVIAVEPVEAMREQLLDHAGSIDVRAGSAESIPVGSGSAGTIVAAQAFHWFDTAASMDEIARVLRPEGRLLTVWNVRDESVTWMARYTDIVDEYAGDTPRYRTMNWRRAIEADDRFTLVSETAMDNPQPTDADGVVARALSTSFIAASSSAVQERVVARIRQAVGGLGDRFEFPYRSEIQVWGFNP